MSATRNSVTIVGPVAPVFDLATQARFWPRWHPASKAVAGVVERPYQLGDVIQERGEFGTMQMFVTWRVVEHIRPQRVTLQSESHHARIDYSFEPQANGVLFTRVLEYDEAALLPIVPDPVRLRLLMHEQSEQGLAKMKSMIEGLIQSEAERLQ